MFKWFHEFSTEVDIPLPFVWDYCMNPRNWHKWNDDIEPCDFEGELELGSIIKMKAKRRNFHLPVLVKELKPYQTITTYIKVGTCYEEKVFFCEEISSTKTRFTLKIHARHFLMPFMKSYLRRRVNKLYAKTLRSLLEAFENRSTSEVG